MTLQTDRLRIREILTSDIGNIHELHSLPETDQYNTLGIPDSLGTTQKIADEWLAAQTKENRISYVFCLEHLNTKEFIGLIALTIGKPAFKNAEVWYKIHVTNWRKGYTTEALNAILHFGFNSLQLHRIEAGCAVENTASIKVLEKVGMKREGRKRKVLPIRGQWKDNYFYAILEEDYYALHT